MHVDILALLMYHIYLFLIIDPLTFFTWTHRNKMFNLRGECKRVLYASIFNST